MGFKVGKDSRSVGWSWVGLGGGVCAKSRQGGGWVTSLSDSPGFSGNPTDGVSSVRQPWASAVISV